MCGRAQRCSHQTCSFPPPVTVILLDGMGSLTLFVFLVLSLVLLANAADLYKVLDR